MFRALGRPIARLGYVRSAILEKADLSAFRRRPGVRLVIGVTLITVSALMGWPAVALTGCVAVQQGAAWIFFVGGPAVYAVSWILWGVGLLVAGRDALRHPNLFTRWFLRVTAEQMLGGRNAALTYMDTLPPKATAPAVEITDQTTTDNRDEKR